MAIAQSLNSIRYLTNAEGKITDVLIQMEIWQEIIYLQVNSRQFKCNKCGKTLTETLEIKPFRRAYTKRLALDIVTRVLSSNILAIAKQTSLSE